MPNYPLIEHASEPLQAASGRPLAEVTLDEVAAGSLNIADVQISGSALRAQAEIAQGAGYEKLAANLIRAAELTAVPNTELLRMYDTLRPGRATHPELLALAQTLEETYNAPENARLVREAAAAYFDRGLTRRDENVTNPYSGGQ